MPRACIADDERRRSVVDRDRVGDTVDVGELSLESLDVFALGELPGAQHLEYERSSSAPKRTVVMGIIVPLTSFWRSAGSRWRSDTAANSIEFAP